MSRIKDVPNRKKVSFHINTYQKPSLFCEELLKECDLDDVQIIDTPGVSGNVEAKRVAKSDIYIFLIKPDNSDEAQTLKDIVTQIKADVATSKVAFLYKKEGLFLTLQKYKSAQNSVKEDIKAFSDLFSEFKRKHHCNGVRCIESHKALPPFSNNGCWRSYFAGGVIFTGYKEKTCRSI